MLFLSSVLESYILLNVLRRVWKVLKNLSLGLFLRKPNYILVLDWRQPFSHVKRRQHGLKNLIWTFYLIFEEKAPRPVRNYVRSALSPTLRGEGTPVLFSLV